MEQETGIRESNIKNIFREAARQGLIQNLEGWFTYHTARNLTSQTYNEDTAEETYAFAKQFAGDADFLLQMLEEKNANESE